MLASYWYYIPLSFECVEDGLKGTYPLSLGRDRR